MGIDIRLPQITDPSEKGQLRQIKSYLFQLAEQLQWALNNVEASNNTVVVAAPKVYSAPTSYPIAPIDEEESPEVTFAALKPLIIKSAEIVDAYYEEINKRIEGLYVAQSDFGTFVEQTSQEIEQTSKATTQQFENVQIIITGLDSNIGSIEGSIQTIGEDLSYAQRDIVNLNSNIEAIDGNVTSLSGNVNELDQEIKTVGETITVIDSELKTVGGNISTLDSNLKAVEGNVGLLETDLQDTKTGIDANLGLISEEVGMIDSDLQGVKAGVESNIKNLNDEVGQLDTKLDDTKSAIDSDLKSLKDNLDKLNYSIIEVFANIKSGLLYYNEAGIPVYGLEVGQKNIIDGVEVFNKYARFTAGRLSFYDQNGTEVAYISDYKIYITHAEVTGTLKLGGYLVDTSKGVTFKWVGRS